VKRVLVVGELNVDLILQGYATFPAPGKEVLVDDFQMTLGSASAICAAGLAKLGTSVAFLSKVGRDPWGDYCVAALERGGVDVTRVEHDPRLKTGVTVSISSPRDRALVSYLGAISALKGADVPDAALAGFDHLHVSAYYLQHGLRPDVPSLFERATRRGLTTSLDPGFDPNEAWGPEIRDALRHTDLFFPNEVELEALTHASDPVAALRTFPDGRTRVIAKLGSQGAMALDAGMPVRVPAFPVTPVDTTGAGDSFNAGFLEAWLRGRPLVDCLLRGAACGALSTRGAGGTATQATPAEVDALLLQARA
jgi:sugar/nucleoside kinase (ribokinase family)